MHGVAIQNILNGKTPAAQRNWKKALRGWIDHCISLKLIRKDPLAEVTLTKMKTRGHHPWESAECEQFEKHHAVGTRARLAYELLLQAGQSRCDIVRMGRQHIRKGVMTMGRQKTGVPFNVKMMPRLQAAMDAMPASNHLTFLVTAQGNPFTAAGSATGSETCAERRGCRSDAPRTGLRKAAAQYLAEQGATDHHLMAWFGWNSSRRRKGTPEAANRKRLAQSAAKLISGTNIGPPSTRWARMTSNPFKM